MALTAADLIAPKGELEPTLFSATDAGGSVTARVEAALAQIATVNPSAGDEAKAAWVYARVFRAKSSQIANLPASMSVDGQSQTWREDQVTQFSGLARLWQTRYDELTQTEAVPAVRRSRSVRGTVVW